MSGIEGTYGAHFVAAAPSDPSLIIEPLAFGQWFIERMN